MLILPVIVQLSVGLSVNLSQSGSSLGKAFEQMLEPNTVTVFEMRVRR